MKYSTLIFLLVTVMTTSCREAGNNTPEQHIAPPFGNERLSARYTEEIFKQERRKLEEEAAAVIEEAKRKMAQGAPRDKLYREAKQALTRLQDDADQEWKGHGPEILAPSLEKLEKIFNDR